MSTTIRKALGYALTDVEVNDLRINWGSPLLDDSETLTFQDLAEAIERRDRGSWDAESMRVQASRTGVSSLDACVIHDPDNADPAVLLIIPPVSFGDLFRRDDMFDYTEAHFGGEGPKLEPALTPVPAGIYPWDGVYFDTETGLELPSSRLQAFRYVMRHDTSKEHRDQVAQALRSRNEPEQELFATAAQAMARIAPVVPSSVRALVEYGMLFTSADVWKQLRPAHYKYWA